MNNLEQIARVIDRFNFHIGRVAKYLIIPICLIILYEVIMRYFLVKSQNWVPEISLFLFSALFLFGGGYAYNSHVKLDMLYNKLSPKKKAILDIITSAFFFIFCGVFIWRGSLMAWDSFMKFERTMSAFGPVVFPIKFVIPIGAFLLMIQGISKLLRDILVLKGKQS